MLTSRRIDSTIGSGASRVRTTSEESKLRSARAVRDTNSTRKVDQISGSNVILANKWGEIGYDILYTSVIVVSECEFSASKGNANIEI